MIKTRLFSKDKVAEDVGLDDWRSLVETEGGLLWVDARSMNNQEIELLRSAFGLHDIAIESVTEEYRRPHLYQFSDHFYVNLTMISPARNESGFEASEIHLFVGAEFIITATKKQPCAPIDNVIEDYKNAPELSSRGVLYAVYLLAEDLVEAYYPVVDKLDDDADKLQDLLLDQADNRSLKRNFDLKDRAFELRKMLSPQRDILNEMARREFPFIKEENRLYFQDVYNRIIRLFDILDTVREILSSNLDIYLSTISNRLNEVMKVLTVFATILMTLSFITGFYGMNFSSLPWLHSQNGFRNMLIFMGVITAGMLLWFKRRRWI